MFLVKAVCAARLQEGIFISLPFEICGDCIRKINVML
jgi:hypothetical protein